MAIFTLLKANIRHKKGAFKSIILLMLMVTMSLAAIMSMNDNLLKSLEKSIESADIGDFVAFIKEEVVTPDFISAITSNPNVERINDISSIAAMNIKINNNKSAYPMQIVPYDSLKADLGVFNERETGFMNHAEPPKSGEIYVPYSVKALFKCEIGDAFSIKTRHGDESFRIKGFVEEPLVGAYINTVRIVYIAQEDYTRLVNLGTDLQGDTSPLLIQYRLLHIFQKENSALSVVALKKELNSQTGLIDFSYATLSKADSMMYTTMVTDILSGILYVFIILLVIILLIVMGNSISMGIEMDYVNLGVLKAQGFTKETIRIIITLQYVIAEIIGAVMGVLCAIPLTKFIGTIFQPITGILASTEISLLKCLGIILGILFIGGLFVFVKTAKIGKISPVRAISGGHSDVYFDNWFRVPIRRKGLLSKLALRQITSSKRQYLGTVFVVAILVYFMMSITILSKSVDTDAVTGAYGSTVGDIIAELNVGFDGIHRDEIKGDISVISPVRSMVLRKDIYMSVEHTKLMCTAYEASDDFKSILKGRAPLYDNEIILTALISEELEKGIGDTVLVSYEGISAEYLVCGLFQTTTEAGRNFGLLFDGMNKLVQTEGGSKFEFADMYITLLDPEKAQEVTVMLNNKYAHAMEAKVTDGSEDLTGMITVLLRIIALIIYFISICFTLIVVNMVCGKMFLKEQQDIGIYKAMGFTTPQLRMQFALRFLLIALFGAALGAMGCLLFNRNMMHILIRSMGITNFTTEYTPFMIIMPIAMICTCFFLFSYLVSRKIKTIAVKDLIME